MYFRMLITNLLVKYVANKGIFWKYDGFRVVLFPLFVPFSRVNIFIVSPVYIVLRMSIWISNIRYRFLSMHTIYLIHLLRMRNFFFAPIFF